jgi:hypothetical protein
VGGGAAEAANPPLHAPLGAVLGPVCSAARTGVGVLPPHPRMSTCLETATVHAGDPQCSGRRVRSGAGLLVGALRLPVRRARGAQLRSVRARSHSRTARTARHCHAGRSSPGISALHPVPAGQRGCRERRRYRIPLQPYGGAFVLRARSPLPPHAPIPFPDPRTMSLHRTHGSTQAERSPREGEYTQDEPDHVVAH